MRLLADQDIYALTVEFLRQLGHDVVTASDCQLSSASDTQVLEAAINDQRILLTRDRDFGGLVFVNAIRAGVIYLRILPTTVSTVHQELERVLANYEEVQLLRSLAVSNLGVIDSDPPHRHLSVL